MKKLYFLVLFSLLISISLFAQNKLWGSYDPNFPYKSIYELPLFNTDLDCDNINQEVAGYNGGGLTPISELMLSKTNGRMYSLLRDYAYGEDFYLSEYDKDLDSITYVYEFTGSFSSQLKPFGNLNETNENIYLLALFQNSTNTSVILCRYNINNHTVDSLANISTIGYSCYESTYAFIGDEGYISLTDANDSCIYGVTKNGGDNNKGILFKYDIVNDTLTKKIDFDDTYKPTGYLFKTKANKLYYTSDDKLMEYDNINDTLIIVSQFPSTIPEYLVEGYNNEFYGVYGMGLIYKLDIINNSMDTIFNISSIPTPSPDPGTTILSGNMFLEKITFLSNGNIVGFYGYISEYEGGYGPQYDISLFNLVNEYSNYWTFHSEEGPSIVSQAHINQKMIEVCYPVSVNVMEIIEVGDSIFLEDEYQTTAGIYHDTFQSLCGCDSSVTTQLIVADVLYQDTISICDGDTAYIGTTPVTEAGMYYETYPVAAGDSIHQLELIVNPSLLSNTTLNICPGDSALFHGNYYTEGYYHFNYTNEFGCDSIYNLHVHVTLTANIHVDDTVFYTGTSYDFTGLESGESPGSFTFQWVITPSSYSSNPLYYYVLGISFQDTVEYTIMLLKTNSCGTDTAYFTVHPEIFIGVDDYSIDSDIRVFPNPAKEFVTIKTKFNKIKQIDIFDISGRNVKSIKNINDNKILDIDLSRFEKGIYSLKIITNKGIILKKLIVE